MRRFAVIWMSLLLLFLTLRFETSRGESYSEPVPRQYAYTLLAGTRIPVLIQESLSTEHTAVGQPVRGMVAQDIFVGETRVVTKAAGVYGRVLESQPPVKGRNAILKLGFDTLTLENGATLPIVAEIQTGSPQRYWGGELTPGTRPEIVPYNVYRIGTYGRVMYRGPRAMGEHINIPAGTWVVLVLLEPVTVYTF